MKKFQDWAKREYSIRQRLIALGFEGIFFILIFPFLLVVSSAAIDRWLQLPRFTLSVMNLIVGLLLVVGGGFLGLWSIQVQVTIGKGTPVPMMPTRRLVVKGPFTYCRNPMTLGTFLFGHFCLDRLVFGDCNSPDTDSRASIICEASRGEGA